MTQEEMLQALQADVNAWPVRVKEAGVKKSNGTAYVPLPRNNAVLRTPDDPQATYELMVRSWEAPDAERGSDGWFRIIEEAGPKLTWEWLMVDESRPYAPLFEPELRDRVRRALEADAGYRVWTQRQQAATTAEAARAERIARIREEIRSGKRPPPQFPELDAGR